MIDSTVATARQAARAGLRQHGLLAIVSIALIALPAIFVAAVNHATAYDDAFITYRYAYNLASGNGFVYNSGEWFLGTTAPFYGLILGGLGAILGPESIPQISGVLSGAALLLTGIALYAYGRINNHAFCGLLAGLFFVTNRLLPLTFGGEMLFQAMLIAWAFVAYRGKRHMATALLLALAVLTRMDSLVAVGVLGLHYLVTQRRLPWREGALAGAIWLPFMLLSWAYYGSLLPGTLDAKLAQRDSGLWAPFATGLFEWIRAFTVQGSSPLFPTIQAAPNAIRFVLFVALGLPALLLYRFWLLPLAWVVLYLLAYTTLAVPFYHWYAVPAALGLMILAACGVAGLVELVVRGLAALRGPRAAELARALLSLLVVLALAPGLYAQLRQTHRLAGANPAEQLYERTGRWLAANTPADASVGYFEIGRVGYYAQRTVIDPLGLVNPGVAPNLASGDLTWGYRHYQPDYIIYHEHFAGWFGSMLSEPWFAEAYTEVARIEQPGFTSLVVYQRTSP